MKVIFLEDVAGTADAGDVKVVKNGFARNFLLPRNLAAPATPDQLQRLHAIQQTAQEKLSCMRWHLFGCPRSPRYLP